MESAIDLSLRNSASSVIMSASSSPSKLSVAGGVSGSSDGGVPIVRPIPRPPWSILWYQNLWSMSSSAHDQSRSTREPNCGDDETGKTLLLRSTERSERSSFTVLNSLSTNNNSFCYSSPVHYAEPVLPFSTSHELHQQQNFEDKGDEYDDDSDNSENIVVTSSKRDSIIKSTCSSPTQSDTTENLFHHHHNRTNQTTTVILDIACCDGPVQFKRISNPNFALTVEHSDEVCPPPPSLPLPTRKKSEEEFQQKQTHHQTAYEDPPNERCSDGGKRYHVPHHHQYREEDEEANNSNATSSSSTPAPTTVTTHKSYLCIYCNQSFKSLFCYQKHKKRHLNPVSVDITTTTANSTSYRGGGLGTSSRRSTAPGGGSNSGGGCASGGGGSGGRGFIGIIPENAKAKTKDLNVQFFPCKKCGSKFPSYYFVHKHRKICH